MQRTITSIATPVPICTSSFAETLEWKGKKLVDLALIRVFSQQFQLTFSTCTRFLYMYLYLYYGIISSTLIVLSTPSRCHQAQPPITHPHPHTLPTLLAPTLAPVLLATQLHSPHRHRTRTRTRLGLPPCC